MPFYLQGYHNFKLFEAHILVKNWQCDLILLNLLHNFIYF